MDKRLFVVDNFYSNPDDVRAFAMGIEYEGSSQWYKGKRSKEQYNFPGIQESFEQIMNMKLKPLLLAVAPSNMFEAQRILYSELRVDSANNDLNAIKSLGLFSEGFIVNEHFTANDAYFIKTNAPEGAKMITSVEGEFSNDGAFESGDHKYKFMTAYAIGVTDPRGYYASEGV